MRIKQIMKAAPILVRSGLKTAVFLMAAVFFCGTACAAPVPAATASDASAGGVQGEVFVSPDFQWSEETPGDFTVRFTITNRSNMMIPETEVRIVLPEPEIPMQFLDGPGFSGRAPENGSLRIPEERELLLELTDFQVGDAFTVAVNGRMGEDIENSPGTEQNSPEPAQGTEQEEEPAQEQEQVFRPGAMNVSLVLRGYGEEHATALDYRIPDLVREEAEPQEEQPQPEPQVLSMLTAALTGTGQGSVTADVVEGPIDRSILFMNKTGGYPMHIMHFPAGKEAQQRAEYPFTPWKFLPVLAGLSTLLALYLLYCIHDVQRRARAFRFDPLSKTHEKR